MTEPNIFLMGGLSERMSQLLGSIGQGRDIFYSTMQYYHTLLQFIIHERSHTSYH